MKLKASQDTALASPTPGRLGATAPLPALSPISSFASPPPEQSVAKSRGRKDGSGGASRSMRLRWPEEPPEVAAAASPSRSGTAPIGSGGVAGGGSGAEAGSRGRRRERRQVGAASQRRLWWLPVGTRPHGTTTDLAASRCGRRIRGGLRRLVLVTASVGVRPCGATAVASPWQRLRWRGGDNTGVATSGQIRGRRR
uniref:Uncharacterized protein n=1 Tax=Leersia perrieri TaxID=77586 RepID=A0A0D9X3Y7_9ORYZ